MDLIEVLTKAISDERLWKLDSFASLTIRQKDGAYRKAKFSGEDEFFFKGVRMGKRDGVIFEFTPVDARPFEQMEMTEREVFKNLPGFEGYIVSSMGLDASSASFALAKAELVRRQRVAKKQSETRAALTEAERYADNPLYGAF